MKAILQKCISILNDFLLSLKTDRGGFSARKLTSMTLMACVVYAHYMIFRSEKAIHVFIEVIMYDFAMIAVLLGLVDLVDLIKHKREIDNDENK